MTDLDLARLREIAESGIAAGADKPGTYYGPLAAALDPLPVTVLALIDVIERLRDALASSEYMRDVQRNDRTAQALDRLRAENNRLRGEIERLRSEADA